MKPSSCRPVTPNSVRLPSSPKQGAPAALRSKSSDQIASDKDCAAYPNSPPARAAPAILYQENRGYPKAVKSPWLRPRSVLKACKQQVILPDTVDAQILARVALADETVFFQEPDRAGIGRDAGGFQPVQPKLFQREWDDGIYRRGHVALPRIRQAHPITEAAGLGDAA